MQEKTLSQNTTDQDVQDYMFNDGKVISVEAEKKNDSDVKVLEAYEKRLTESE